MKVVYVLGGALLLLLAAVFVTSFPDLVRYMKMRRMS